MSPEMMMVKALSTKEPEIEKVAEAEVEDTEAMDKLAWADEFGRELAREHVKTAALPGMVQKGLGHAMGALTTSSGVKRGLVGAGVGAAAGALKDPGQGGSRLGNMATGAAMGAGAGVAAGHLARSAGSMNNVVGKTLGGAQTAVAKQTGNIASMNQGRQMAVARGAAQKTKALNPGASAPGVASQPVAPKPAAPAAQKPGFFKRMLGG